MEILKWLLYHTNIVLSRWHFPQWSCNDWFSSQGYSLDRSCNGSGPERCLFSDLCHGGVCECSCFPTCVASMKCGLSRNVAVTHLPVCMLSGGIGGDLGKAFLLLTLLFLWLSLYLNLFNPLGSLIIGYMVVLLQALQA